MALFLCGALWAGKAWSSQGTIVDCTPELATRIASANATAEYVDVKVSSLNLREFRFEDGFFNKSPWQIRELGRLIRTVNPDVLTVQEVATEESLLVFNRRYLENKYDVYFRASRDKYGNHVAFLVRKDLPFNVKIETHDDVTWRDVDGRERYLFTHGVPALILLKKGTRYVSAVVLGYHGKSNALSYDFRGDVRHQREINARLQRAQIYGLRNLVFSYEKRFPDAVMVATGDYNMDILNSPLFNPLRNYMTDSFDIAGLPKFQRITHMYFARGNRIPEMRQLDAILVNPNGIDAVLGANVQRYRSRNGGEQTLPRSADERDLLQPSDHYMIWSILRLRR